MSQFIRQSELEKGYEEPCTCAKWFGVLPHGPSCRACRYRAALHIADRIGLTPDMVLYLVEEAEKEST